MERKYWVPALERAQEVLTRIAEEPSKLKLMDLSAATGINKSTMFSLLHTMEVLNWVVKEKGDTYALGSAFGMFGNAYFAGMNVVKLFEEKAERALHRIGETLHMAKLEKGELVYLAKKEPAIQLRLISEPGMRVPAYATALGKVLLSELEDQKIRELYVDGEFQAFTPNTIQSNKQLIDQLNVVRASGYAFDLEEVVQGFCCVAAPIVDRNGRMIAAVSCSMPIHQWQSKQPQAIEEIQFLAQSMSAVI